MAYYENAGKCPGCGTPSLPRIADESSAMAATCQNPECRRVFDRAGVQVGRWTEGYSEYEAEGKLERI